MQLKLPWLDSSKPRARQITIEGQPVPVTVMRHRLARRYVVRLAPDGEGLRLTVPRGASLAGGFAFAARQSAWISRELDRQRERHAPWRTGSLTWFRGEQVSIDVFGSTARFGEEVVHLHAPDASVREAIEAKLRTLATDELPRRCLALAREAGVRVADVSVRNQRSRWGACSSKHVITLNWRLVQMPTSVADYVIFHELMHVRQPNHSRRFWREVDSVCGWWRDAEWWLRKHGRELLPSLLFMFSFNS